MTKRFRTAALLLAALAATAAGAAAQQVIGTAFGQTLTGELISDDGSKIVFRTGEGTQMTLPYSELDAQTVFRLMDAKTAPTDAAGQMRCGDQAAAAKLFDDARDAYALAVKADPSLTDQVDAKLTALRRAASESLLAEAKHASEHGRPDVALHDLTTLMHEFSDEPAAQEGRAMLDSLQASQTKARSAAKAQSQSAAVQQALAPIESSYQEMGKKIKEGMQNAASQSTAINDFNSAIETGKSARDSLHQMQGQAAATPGLAAASQELDGELQDQIVNAYTQLANVYNQRSSYNDANTAIQQGLVLEPKNQDLLQLQSQIASNSADSSVSVVGGNGYVAGGGGYVVGWRMQR